MRSSAVLLFLLATCPITLADVTFTAPAAGSIFEGNAAIDVSWVDSGDAPSIADLKDYNIYLYSGSNADPKKITPLLDGSFSNGNAVKVTVPVDVGGSTANAYFLGIISTATTGETVTAYSDRFTLSGMTGAFDTDILAGLASVSGTSGPENVNAFTAQAVLAARATVVAGAQFGTPFNLQTGSIRYAAMPIIPGTTITATNTVPLYAPSPYTVATTWMGSPTIISTISQAQTASFASHVNTAAAASQPTPDAMQRFLNRWKD